jgi:hypothetical protein
MSLFTMIIQCVDRWPEVWQDGGRRPRCQIGVTASLLAGGGTRDPVSDINPWDHQRNQAQHSCSEGCHNSSYIRLWSDPLHPISIPMLEWKHSLRMLIRLL